MFLYHFKSSHKINSIFPTYQSNKSNFPNPNQPPPNSYQIRHNKPKWHLLTRWRCHRSPARAQTAQNQAQRLDGPLLLFAGHLLPLFVVVVPSCPLTRGKSSVVQNGLPPPPKTYASPTYVSERPNKMKLIKAKQQTTHSTFGTTNKNGKHNTPKRCCVDSAEHRVLKPAARSWVTERFPSLSINIIQKHPS